MVYKKNASGSLAQTCVKVMPRHLLSHGVLGWLAQLNLGEGHFRRVVFDWSRGETVGAVVGDEGLDCLESRSRLLPEWLSVPVVEVLHTREILPCGHNKHSVIF